MGWAWNGVCFPDTASALNAFAVSVPTSDGTAINTFTAAPTVTSGGLVSFSVQSRNWSSNSVVTRAGTVQLQSCTNVDMSQYPLQSELLIAALAFAAFAGFRTGFRP